MDKIAEYKRLISMYGISDTGRGTLRIRASVPAETLDFIRAEKSGILEYLQEAKVLEKRRNAALASMEGIDEIRKAVYAIRNFHRQFNDAMDNEDYRPIKRPDIDLDALYKKYPIAKAYLDAEAFGLSENFAKSKIGKDAMNRILDGENHENVISDMNAEWSEYVNRHAFDY